MKKRAQDSAPFETREAAGNRRGTNCLWVSRVKTFYHTLRKTRCNYNLSAGGKLSLALPYRLPLPLFCLVASSAGQGRGSDLRNRNYSVI
jgi:hypothetical protein